MEKQILVVDDEPHITRIIQVHLQRMGYRISIAADGFEGLQKVGADRPDLILLDVTMPRMDGFEMLRRLKASPETESIPVVMLTARAQDADFHEGHRAGAEEYLTKPFHPQDLLEIVRRILSRQPVSG